MPLPQGFLLSMRSGARSLGTSSASFLLPSLLLRAKAVIPERSSRTRIAAPFGAWLFFLSLAACDAVLGIRVIDDSPSREDASFGRSDSDASTGRIDSGSDAEAGAAEATPSDGGADAE